MDSISFREFYQLYSEAVDARKSNSKSPHINKVERESKKKWDELIKDNPSVKGIRWKDRLYKGKSARAIYTSFFLDLCENENFFSVFDTKGYFYREADLLGDKEWEKDFVRVGNEDQHFHADCQVFVFWLKAVRAIVDLNDASLLDEFSFCFAGAEEMAETELVSIDDCSINNQFDYTSDYLSEILLKASEIMFRADQEAVRKAINSIQNGEMIDDEIMTRVDLAVKKLKKCKEVLSQIDF